MSFITTRWRHRDGEMVMDQKIDSLDLVPATGLGGAKKRLGGQKTFLPRPSCHFPIPTRLKVVSRMFKIIDLLKLQRAQA